MLKNTVPLLITATTGFVLIVASFIPATVSWGETAAVWFDILAAIAFVLGGGNLLMHNLKKISNRNAGWGYAVVTLVAFLITLVLGLAKFGAPPSTNQEFYGEVFADLSLTAFPESQVFTVEGEIPVHTDDEYNELPPSVHGQLRETDGKIEFTGWMQRNQAQDLRDYDSSLAWRCRIEQLAEKAQPPESLRGKIRFRKDHEALSFQGVMTGEDRETLLDLSSEPEWQDAVAKLYEQTRTTTENTLPDVLGSFTLPDSMTTVADYNTETRELAWTGPMSPGQRDTLADQFPRIKPLDAAAREEFVAEIEAAGGELTEEQQVAFEKTLDTAWTVEQFTAAINQAGIGKAPEKTACELLDEMQSSDALAVNPKKEKPDDVELNVAQIDAIEEFAASDSQNVDELIEAMADRGELTDAQKAAIRSFWKSAPTVGQRNVKLFQALATEGELTPEQKQLLTEDARRETIWTNAIANVFFAAHQTKYPWSGDYTAAGSPFWWIYEYLFKPLTATMFALLAFYIASAAFRAFRAKNVEAALLLGTAFIILLGRTYAGVWLTQWLPETSPFRIENMSVFIGQVFNTAGMRAIMIGIALGVVSTSLKVLLGIDRSYLGSSDD
ncbi:hypothetical protein [Thalassoroseus pseudoceratinae]|uniref:hypothetical protein n=1 Tax=Thalassoroseus pseudoceratinae TaxID=2713176 RepID=UPI00141F6DF3|nr:hypothetical protein [Thalassoroseus pseudoceratinae]